MWIVLVCGVINCVGVTLSSRNERGAAKGGDIILGIGPRVVVVVLMHLIVLAGA